MQTVVSHRAWVGVVVGCWRRIKLDGEDTGDMVLGPIRKGLETGRFWNPSNTVAALKHFEVKTSTGRVKQRLHSPCPMPCPIPSHERTLSRVTCDKTTLAAHTVND
jgi:hypothetical protein